MCPDKDEAGSPYWECYAFDNGCDTIGSAGWYECYWGTDCTVYNATLAAAEEATTAIEEPADDAAADTTTDDAAADTTTVEAGTWE